MKRHLFATALVLALVVTALPQVKLTGGKLSGGKLTASAGGGGGSNTPWLTVTAWSGGTPGATSTRSDYDGWLGAEFTVGASPISVTHLCRVRATGNSASHNVKIVRVSDSTTVIGPVSVDVSTGTVGDFVCAAATGILSASTTYVVASSEVNAGDGWYNDLSTTLSATGVATLDFSVYSSDGTTGQAYSHNNVSMSYIPVNFKY